MAINALTVKRLQKAREKAEAETMNRTERIQPVYYLVRFGSSKYESEIAFSTRTEARDYVRWLYGNCDTFTYANITRRYRHGAEIQTGKVRRKAIPDIS